MRDLVPSLASTVNGVSVEEMVEQAQSFVADGYDVVRLGRIDALRAGDDPLVFEPRRALSATADGMARARAVLGASVTLGLDFHHRLSVAETISFFQRMPAGTLDFLEEPIRDETPEAYEALRRAVQLPFAIGEEFASKWQALPYIERGLANYMRIDICNIGGFTEALKIAGWCEAHYVDLMPHNPLGPICTAASIHLGAVVPNFSWLEYNRSRFRPQSALEHDLFPVQPALSGTAFAINDSPGIGIEVDESLLRSDRFQHWNPPQLRRSDGSVTNW